VRMLTQHTNQKCCGWISIEEYSALRSLVVVVVVMSLCLCLQLSYVGCSDFSSRAELRHLPPAA
jgi:hypothetical protein